MEKRDNIFLVGDILAIILWLKFAYRVPKEDAWLYLFSLGILLLPLFYFLRLKRQVYQWSLEALFYFLFLTGLGVISFSNSILDISPLAVLKDLAQSIVQFWR